MSLDITSLLLGSAFALFLTLLAWGDQIRNPRKEVTELEERFRTEFNIDKKVLNPLLRKSYDTLNCPKKYSFLEQTRSMISVLENKKLKGDNIKLLNIFRKLHDIRKDLEKKYKFRYIFSIWFCVVLFILGIISLFTAESSFTLAKINLPINLIFLCIAIIFITIYIISNR